MGLTFLSSVHWAVTSFIEVMVLFLALRHRFFSRLPIFTTYLSLLVINEGVLLLAYELTGIASHVSFYVYWVMQAAQIAVRTMVVYEICRILLSPYAGVWRLSRPLLIAIAVALVTAAIIISGRSAYALAATILTAERGLELTVVSVLIFGLLFCRYYGITVRGPLLWIAVGLGCYSAIQVADNTFLQHWLSYFSLWETLRRFSFDLALFFWAVAVWKPFPAPGPVPALLESGYYAEIGPRLTTRMRELNSRLLEMWK